MPTYNSWESATEAAEKFESGIFLSLKDDGSKVIGVFVGEPFAREVHWVDNKYVDCAGSDCKCCRDGERKSLRVSINFYDMTDKTVKIWEFGASIFKDIVKVKKKYGLEGQAYEIERHGKPKDPKTTYSILPEGGKLSKEEVDVINAVPLHDPQDLAGVSQHLTAVDGLVALLPVVIRKPHGIAIQSAVRGQFP